ncbi:MAG: PfkB family carbohydrate kinase [Bacteroidetes bacterium]|jgi:sugar/nucleoside kinase (ribokinase family)|nr:PfkB family carbohydrate kinase [Bacteroidota bacterium]
MSLIIVGTVAFDAIQTPFGSSGKVVGGAASYIGLSASQFVKEQHIISVIGDDFPQAFVEELESRGIQTEGLERRAGEKSFFWEGKYHMDMNSRDTLTTELNVLADFQPRVPEAAQSASYVMLGNLDPSVQLSVLDQLYARPKLVVLDTMNFWMDIALEPLKKVLERVDVLTINDEEARQLSGEHSLVKAANKILTMGPSTLVIKKGEHGALLFNEDEIFFAPALPLEEVLDPTGAGDTFAGGFIGYLAHTDDTSFTNMKRAVVLGSAMASFACEKFGTDRLMELTQAELDIRIQRFVDLVDFDILLKD